MKCSFSMLRNCDYSSFFFDKEQSLFDMSNNRCVNRETFRQPLNIVIDTDASQNIHPFIE